MTGGGIANLSAASIRILMSKDSALRPLRIHYSEAFCLPNGPETVTKSRLVAQAVRRHLPSVEIVAPAPATKQELLAVHDEAYLDRVFGADGGETALGDWSEPLLASILATTGGVRDAVTEALRSGRSGSLSSGLHHAGRSYGTGYCTLNGLALAALHALRSVPSVGILDLDAHCGGGTADILADDPRVRLVDVSVSSFDRWTPSDKARHHLRLVKDPEEYLEAVDEALGRLEGVSFLIYNAGMDAHGAAGGLEGVDTPIIRERERRVVAWAESRRVPVIFALAGGYRWDGLTLEQVADLHLETVRAFAA